MKIKKIPPPRYEEWNLLPLPIRIYIGWRFLKSIHWEEELLKIIYRVDLWLFPPMAFFACYKSISRIIPAGHPMAFNAVMATSFMCATLTLFLLRPITKKQIHWVSG